MNKRLARAATLLAMVGWSWIAPQPALAQLLPPLPIGSLIVTVTSPASGATIRDTIPVNASVSIVGSLTVANVEFFVDGNFIGSDSTASYSVSWNTRNVGNGSHSLTAVARDALGVRWTSNPVTVTVANDITRPTVTINQAAGQADPTNAAPINFTVVFSEAVSGFTGADVAISGTAGGTKTVTVSGGPSTYTVAVSGMTSSGPVSASIAAGVAQDAAGNTNSASTSTDNTVTFNADTADTTPPTVAIISPSDGAPVSGTITVTASATDAGGVTVVQFLLNRQQLGALDDTVPYEAVWDTRTVADGSHTLQARAQDAAGNIGESAVVTVTVANGASTGARFEEDNDAVIASPADAWERRGPEVAAFSGGTAGSSDVTDATITFTFTGTGVSWIGYKCTVCGIATVSIDGGPPTEVDTAGPDVPGMDDNFAGQSEPVFAASGLAAGTHTLVIRVTGNTTSGGAHIIIDAFDVTGGTASAATRIEDTDPAVSYTGTWIHGTDPIATSGTFAEAQVAGAVATLSFTGTGVRWLGYRDNNTGIARASVDGEFVGDVDTYSASPELGEVFSAAGLTRGAHTLTIEVTGTRNPDSTDSWVIIDAFEVTP
jgi:hypothetical protein